MPKTPCNCGKPGEWPNGFVDGVEQFLCQDCWEAEIDAAWWTSFGPIWGGYKKDEKYKQLVEALKREGA